MAKVKKRFSLLFTMLLFTTLLLLPNQVGAAQQAYEQMGCSVDRGIDVVFVMDDSSSMKDNDPTGMRIEAAKKMADELQELDRISVIKFNEEAENLLSLTNNRHAIHNALDLLGASGGTDLSEGMGAALEEFKKNSGSNHKIMIVLSDGESINNQISIEHAQTAYEEDIIIYTIGLGAKANLDEETLGKIATKTGGQYFHAANAAHLSSIFGQIQHAVEDQREPKVYSDWTLTKDLHQKGDLVLHENVKMDLNGYHLEVEGDLVLLSCAELRAVSGTVTANNLEQKAGAKIQLNNSQLNVKKDFVQDGLLRVNGAYKGTSENEVNVNGQYNQKIRGYLDLNGHQMKVQQNFLQEGHVYVGGGEIHAGSDVTQKGYFDLQEGRLQVDGNLKVDGGPLVDEQFEENKSLNVNGGLVQVGSAASMAETSKYGNILQTGGQLYVNHGAVRVFGDYTIQDGWLTMVKGSMDTTSSNFGEGDGDYVHVYRNFSMESPRSHAARTYTELGKPLHDQAHLTEGVLQVDGDFRQKGDKQFHPSYSDRSQNYTKDYSRHNFVAQNRHKVWLTGKGKIEVGSTGFQFNLLELEGRLGDYARTGQVNWNQLIEKDQSANAALKSLVINDIPVKDFNPNVLNYVNHIVPANGLVGPLKTLKVEAIADDHRNAKVTVVGNHVGVDGTAQVRVLVTAADQKTEKMYTVNVSVGNASPDVVTSIELDRESQLFIQNGPNDFSPSRVTIGYTVYPKTATNQQVNWTSTNSSVATVNHQGVVTPVGVGQTTIIARTVDGGFQKAVTVDIKPPHTLFEGVKTLADFVADNDRFDQIMSLYDPGKIGIVVPGQYIQSVQFMAVNTLAVGTIKTDPNVNRVEVRMNGKTLEAPKTGTNEFTFNRMGVLNGTYLEVVAFNAAGDELERISTTYPVNYAPVSTVPFGFYSIQELQRNPVLFSLILEHYAPEQLRFTFNS